MSKKNEDSVESFFRKAVDHYDNKFIASDWQKMEKLLDQEAARTASTGNRNLRRGAITGAVITGIIIVVYFLAIDQDHPESRLPVDGLKKEVQAAAGAEAPDKAETKKENPSAALLSLSESGGATEKKITDQIDKLKIQNRNNSELMPQGGDVKKQNDLPLIRTKNSAADNEDKKDDVGYAGNETPSIKELNEKSLTNPSVSERTLVSPENILAQEKQEISKEEIIKTEGNNLSQATEALPSEEKEKRLTPSRWSITMTISPDFSSTQLMRYSSPGSAYGVLVGYRVFDRLTVSSGALKSSKKYQGSGSDYQPPEGYWQRRTNGIIPRHINGQCEVLEVPILIQYGLRETDRSRFFVTGGISSYLMISESYNYIFQTDNPGAANGWSSDESSSHILNIGHLSAGYEAQLTPRIALGIEPFIKLPFTGIGWSNLDLYTTGAYINIRYRILKKENIVK